MKSSTPRFIPMPIPMAPILGAILALASSPARADDEYLAGYLIIPTGERVDRSYNAGFSMYVPVWPLLSAYPGHRFQTGLPGTWMFAQNDGPPLKDMYSDVEGGLGWWTDTRFPTETPKFIMGGVGPNFSEIANGPSHGAGSWDDPRGLYGVVQLSPWILFPIDGLNLRQGTKGRFLGYGYLNLPLIDPKPTTDGQHVPTGGNCWTLFLNANNFKGPVAFFSPYFWSHNGLRESRLVGNLLDTRPVDPNTAIQMETQYIPCRVATDAKGASYARIAPTSFPLNSPTGSALVQQSTSYAKEAIWSSVAAWFNGGKPSSGTIDPKGSFVRSFPGNGYATWEIRIPGPDGKEQRVALDWSAFAHPTPVNAHTYGYRWKEGSTTKSGPLVTLPEYYRLTSATGKAKARWSPIPVDQVPAETGLRKLKWARPVEPPQDPYTTPFDTDPTWKTPGPVAGPFRAHVGDGTVVTYYWYRFADQPALQHAGLTADEREQLQKRVEQIHRSWPKNHNYLAPPVLGTLADIDPALVVKPPKGLEIGYVPITSRQELDRR
ncbi:MAG: hypothetical protein P4L46_24035 [Fimbriimonas sp.]|nr:hypothetical protein [Fimbriimonas sp.]